MANAKDQKLNLKPTKMSDVLGALKAIRQSGHRGTSIFNWITNFVLWTCILAADPWVFVGKTPHKDGQRAWIVQEYTCAFSGRKAILRFIFEGDDSILGSTIDLSVFKDRIETLWYKVGFRMKLIFHVPGSVATFTGYNFRVVENGLCTRTFFPEILRAFARSSWTCSSEVRIDPVANLHKVAACAFYSRAEQFVSAPSVCVYFCQLARAHVRRCGDVEIDEQAGVRLGVSPVLSVNRAMRELLGDAHVQFESRETVDLLAAIFRCTADEIIAACATLKAFECDDPLDTQAILPSISFPATALEGVTHVTRRWEHLYYH